MIKERVIQLIEYKEIRKESFYKKIGVTSANFRGEAKKTPLNSSTIANILLEIPDVNAFWLLTGEGDMLKTDNLTSELKEIQSADKERLLAIIESQQRTIESLSNKE